MKISKQQIGEFQSVIFSWWKLYKRDLPWRHTSDPYNILVSEIMLQQTQVQRVLPKYSEFIKRYPTVTDLANAPTGDILRLWKGMGYNRRALYLHKTAREVVRLYKGSFPKDEQSLMKLPGLGKYTARAVMVFAYRKDVAMVDTNIRQIITHYFFRDEPQTPTVIQKVADQLVPLGLSWEWHQALMDHGALAMSKMKTKRQKKDKGTIPFENTTRFYRGRVIDILRDDAVNEKSLIRDMSKKYTKPHLYIQEILKGLMKDGLVVKEGNVVRLPQ